MKKKLQIIIYSLFISLANISHADNYEMKNDYSDDVIAKETQKIQYGLKVFKDNQLVYSGDISLDNSVITPIFYISDDDVKAGQLESTEIEDTLKLSGKKENKETFNHEIQLRLAVHLSKNKNDMWSQFFFQQVDADMKNSITAVVSENSKNDKKLKTDSSPEAHKVQKEIIVAHQKNKEAIISWQGYRLEFKANLKK